jgi:hypothetical protein
MTVLRDEFDGRVRRGVEDVIGKWITEGGKHHTHMPPPTTTNHTKNPSLTPGLRDIGKVHFPT